MTGPTDLPDQDAGEDEAAGDVPFDQVDWAKTVELQRRYDAVLEIADDDERLAAAKALTEEMGG